MTSARTLFGTILPVFALATASWAAAAPSLTGTWVPDPAASTHSKELKQTAEPGAPPAPPAPAQGIQDHISTLRIRHDEPRVKIEFLEDDGSIISTTDLTTDGTENVNARAGGALTHRSTTAWDGTVLRTSWKLAQNARVVIAGTDASELTSPDTLVVTTTTEDSKSRSRSVIVYHRKLGREPGPEPGRDTPPDAREAGPPVRPAAADPPARRRNLTCLRFNK
ncbi:MAG TPA: hypothetical protein VEW48_14210 [Thermoanaerobaculia bacterium]|nr:hypothetical protein [Thermoanaerobaculia bacterium]